VLLLGCSSESNTWSSKAFHNTTAHYNGYYYAKDEITTIENTIRESKKDDYNRVLWLFPSLDSTLAIGYENEIQEAIKMASLAIERHPNSKWVDDSYILVGKARLYSLDWGNAIQTFKYVNTKGTDINSRHQALLLLARTFTEHSEFDNASAVFSYLEKEKLSKKNRKNLYLEKAYHYQVQGDDNNLVGSLTEAVPLLTRTDRAGRIYFILGQVYQKLGFEAEAYNFFRECLQTHPEYEVDFYARLYMAQVAEISKSRNIANARKSFKKLLKDSKNREFKDKIYYEMGVFERKQHNIEEAISNYQLAVREGSNKQIDGEAFLRMGEIYYDTLKDYEVAKLYYDSAVASLSLEYENFKVIKERQEVLSEFVLNLKTIEWQDSLLVLATLDSATIMQGIQAYYESQKVPETKGKKKKRNRVSINQVSSGLPSSSTFELSDWYFGNPSALALGQQEFRRVWGNIPLEDNWRRSSRATPINTRPADLLNSDLQGKETTTQVVEETKRDPALDEYDRVISELPKTEEQVAQALGKIEEAHFALGDLYYFKLLEMENAVIYFERLLTRFPLTEHRPEVLYKLYLIFKGNDPSRADAYALELKNNFPESSYAKILTNPDYLLESSIALDKQKVFYKSAYEKFENKNYNEALQILSEAMALEKTSFYPNLELLKILVVGKTESTTRYIYSLEEFIKNNAESDLAEYAKQLLVAARDYELGQNKGKEISYSVSFDSPHYFVVVYRLEEKLENVISSSMITFNNTNFKDSRLKVSNLTMNDTYSLTLVSDLTGITSAIKYYRSFVEKQTSINELKNHKFNTFVITKDNFDIFYRTKSLNEYIQFFEKNYILQNP